MRMRSTPELDSAYDLGVIGTALREGILEEIAAQETNPVFDYDSFARSCQHRATLLIETYHHDRGEVLHPTYADTDIMTTLFWMILLKSEALPTTPEERQQRLASELQLIIGITDHALETLQIPLDDRLR